MNFNVVSRFCIALSLLLIGTTSHAQVQVTFQGTITTPGAVPLIAAGDSFTAVLTYNQFLTPINSQNGVANYSPYQLSATVHDAANGDRHITAIRRHC